jgi:hypothetical protein
MVQGDSIHRIRSALVEAGCLIRSDRGTTFYAQCPAHEDRNPSLSVRHANGRTLLKCQRGCENSAILSSLNLTWPDLFDETAPRLPGVPIREFAYTDRYGDLLGTVVRTGPDKSFRPLYANGHGWQLGSTETLKTIPYRIDEVLGGIDKGQPVWIVEGERDADTLWSIGLCGTCNIGGAGKWTADHARHLSNARVINIIADSDAPGHAHAFAVAATLTGSHVNLLEFTDGCKDITDHLAAGHNLGDLHLLAPPDDSPPPPVDPEDIWSFSPEMATIHTFARAQLAAPWAVLGCVLARVLAHIPATVTLPATVGSKGSLNTFIAIVGTSAAGKGAAIAVSRDVLGVSDMIRVEEFRPASGEAIAHIYMKRTKEGLVHQRHEALLIFNEVKTLMGIKGRSGATIVPELTSAWSGESLGFVAADPSRSLSTPEHSYRCSLIVSTQPDNAQGLLEESATGLPQRFLWFTALDPGASVDRPPRPKPLCWSPPREWRSQWVPDSEDPEDFQQTGRMMANPEATIRVCEAARTQIIDNRVSEVQTGAADLDGHALFARLKIAVALAALHGGTEIDERMWELSGLIAAHSDAVRESVVNRQKEAAIKTELAKVERQIRTEAAMESAGEHRAFIQVAERILGVLDHGEATRSDLRRCLTSKNREWFEVVIMDLIMSGKIIEIDTDRGHIYRYRQG